MNQHVEKKRYTPQPLDTGGVKIPEGIMIIADDLAKNIHEVWANRRVAEGWEYGTEHQYVLKKHPSLVPYEELPESEKDYDRNTALETIRYLLSHGYEIVQKSNNK